MPMSNNLNSLNTNQESTSSSRTNNLNVMPTEEITKAKDDAMQNYLAGINNAADVYTPEAKSTSLSDDEKNSLISKYDLMNVSTSTPDESKIASLDINSAKAEDQAGLKSLQDTYKLAQSSSNISSDNSVASLNALGINATSSNYWLSNYKNKNFSDLTDNATIQGQVVDLNRDAYDDAVTQTELSSTIAESQAFSALTKLKNIDLDESGLEFKTVAEMFPSLQALTAVDNDTEFYSALNSGAIETSLRLTQGSDGNYYYLHTDGKMYELGNGTNAGTDGSIELNDDGSYKTIYLGDEALSWATDVTSEFTGVAFSLGELVTGAADLVGELFDADMWAGNNDGKLGLGLTNELKKLQNSSTWLSGSRIDATIGDDGLEDYLHIAAHMVGSIAGSAFLYGTIAGSWLGTSSYTSWAEASNFQRVGFLMKAQSGNFGIVEKNLTEVTYTAANTWGRRLTQAGLSNVRGLLSDFATGVQQAALYSDGSKEVDVLGNAFTNTAINFGIDLVLTGGQDDQQYQQFSSWYHNRMGTMTKDHELMEQLTKYVEGTAEYNQAFKDYMFHKKFMIGWNSTTDFIGNMLSGAFNANYGVSNGKVQSLDSWDEFASAFMNGGNILRSVINTWQYSLKGQVNDLNCGMEAIVGIHTDVYNTLTEKINTAKTPEQAQSLTKLRQEYMDDIKAGSKESSRYEIGLYKALSNLNNKIGEGTELHPLIKDAIDAKAMEAKVKYANEFFTTSKAIYDYYQGKRQKAVGAGKIFQQLNDYLNDPSASNAIEKAAKKIIQPFAAPTQSKSPYSFKADTYEDFVKLYNENEFVKATVDAQTEGYKIEGDKLKWAFDNKVLSDAVPMSDEQKKFVNTFASYQAEINKRARLEEIVEKELPKSTNLKIVAGISSIPESEDGKPGLKEEIASQIQDKYLNKYTFIYVPNDSNKDSIEDNLKFAYEWMVSLEFIKEIKNCPHARGGSVYYYETNDAAKFNTLCLNQDINTTLRLIPYIVQEQGDAKLITDRINVLEEIFDLTPGIDREKFMAQIVNSAYDKMNKVDVIGFAYKYKINDGKAGTLKRIDSAILKNQGRNLDLDDATTNSVLNDLSKAGLVDEKFITSLREKYTNTDGSFTTGSALKAVQKELASHDGVLGVLGQRNSELDQLRKDSGEFDKLINDVCQKVLKGTKNVQPTVKVINLTRLVGKNLQSIINICNSSKTHDVSPDAMRTYGSDAIREINFINKMIKENMGPLIEATPENIKKIEENLKITLSPTVTVVDKYHANDINYNQTTISAKGKTYNLIDYIVPVNGKGEKVKMQEALLQKMNTTRIENINTKFTMNGIPSIGQYIFAKYDENKKSWGIVYNPITDAAALKVGKLSRLGSTVEVTNNILVEQLGGENDKKLSTYFIAYRYLNNIIDSEDTHVKSIPITEEEALNISDDNPFWEVVQGEKTKFAIFKPISSEQIKELLLTRSIYEAFPFKFTQLEPEEVTSYFASNGGFVTAGLVKSGYAFKSAFNAFDRVPWSDEGEAEGEFFSALRDGKFNDGTELTHDFLNVSDEKYLKPISEFKSFDEYYNALKDSQNPEDILIKNYIDSFNSIIDKSYDESGSGNYTLILRSAPVQLALIDMVGRTDYEQMAQDLKDIYNSYDNNAPTKTNIGNQKYSVEGIQAATGNAFKFDPDVVFTAANVEKALSELKPDYSGEYTWDIDGPAKVLSLIAEAGGNIAVSDVQTIRDLITVKDGMTDDEKATVEETKQLLKDLFGDDVIKVIEDRAKNMDDLFTGMSITKKNIINNETIGSATDKDSQLIGLDAEELTKDLRTRINNLNDQINKLKELKEKLPIAMNRLKEIKEELANEGLTEKQKKKLEKAQETNKGLISKKYKKGLKTLISNIRGYKKSRGENEKSLYEIVEQFNLDDSFIEDLEKYYGRSDDVSYFKFAKALDKVLEEYESVSGKLITKLNMLDEDEELTFKRAKILVKGLSEKTFNEIAPDGKIKPLDLFSALEKKEEEFIEYLNGKHLHKIESREERVKKYEQEVGRIENNPVRTLKKDVMDGLNSFSLNKELNYTITDGLEAELHKQLVEINKYVYSYGTSIQTALDKRGDILNVVRYNLIKNNTLADLIYNFPKATTGKDSEKVQKNLEEAASIIAAIHSVKTINDKGDQFYVINRDGTIRKDLITDSEEALYIELSNDPETFKNSIIISASYKDNNDWKDTDAIKMHMIDFQTADGKLNQKLYDEVVDRLFKKNLYNCVVYGKLSDEDFKKALQGKLSTEKMQEALNKIPLESVSTISKLRKIWSEKFSYMGYEEFAYLYRNATSDYLKNIGILNDAIRLQYGEDIEQKKVSAVYNFVFKVGDPDVMSDERRRLILDVRDMAVDLARQIGDDTAANIIEQKLVDGNAAAIDFLVRNRDLREMIKKFNEPVKDTDTEFYPVIGMDKGTVDALVTRIKNHDYKGTFAFDTETGFNESAANKIFQFAYTDENGNKHTYFIAYDENFKTDRAAREDYAVKVNLKDNDYFENKPGYRKAVIDFLNGNGEFITVPELIKLFQDNQDKVLIGYNDDAFDIPILNKLFEGKYKIDSTTHKQQIDVIKLLLNSGNEQRDTYKLDINKNKEEFEKQFEAHDAGNDALETLNRLSEATEAYKSVNKITYSIAEEFKDVSPEVINRINSYVSDARQRYISECRELFGNDKIDVETVTDARSILRAGINNALNNTLYLLKDANEANQFFLTKEARVALENDSYKNIDKVYSFCFNNAANKAAQDYLQTHFYSELACFIKNTKGSVSLNNILEFASDENQLKNFVKWSSFTNKELTDLNGIKVDSEDTSDSVSIAVNHPKFGALIDSDKFDNYRKFRQAGQIYYAFDQVLNQLKGYIPESEETAILAEMTKVLSTPDGHALLQDNDYERIVNRFTDKEYEYLKDKAGTVDGLVSQKGKGSYSLFGQLKYGTYVKDALTGKPVQLDASCIVVSKKMAKTLGIDVNQKRNVPLYTYVVSQPGDNNQKMIPVKIVIDDSKTNRQSKQVLISEVTAMLLSRDFDGDHTVVLKPRDGNQEALALWCSKMYNAENFQETILHRLRANQKIDYETLKFRTDPNVTRICREMDAALKAGNIEEADALQERLKGLTSESFAEKYGKTKTATTGKFYVANPEAWRDDNGNISYSATVKNQELYERYKLDENKFKPIDSTTGQNAKQLINVIQGKTFKTMKDFVTYGTYMTDIVEEAIDNCEDIKSAAKVIEDAAKEFGYEQSYKTLKPYIDTAINANNGEGDRDSLKMFVDMLIKDGEANREELYNENSYINQRFTELLKTSDSVINNDKFKLLTAKVNRINEINKYKDNSLIGSDPYQKFSLAQQFQLDKILDDNDDTLQMVDLLKQNENNYKVLIIDRVDNPDGTDEWLRNEDVITYNLNAKKKVYVKDYHTYDADKFNRSSKLGAWSSTAHKVGRTNEGEDINANIIIRKGDKYITGEVKEINGDQKIATGPAGKGALAFDSFDNKDIQFAVFSKDGKSKFANSTTLDKSNEVYFKQGNAWIHGHIVDAPVVVAEDNENWIGLRDRQIDILQIISNANSISALELGLLGLDDKGENLISRVGDYRQVIAGLDTHRSNGQYTNYLPLLNRIKFSIVINKMSDEQIEDAFGGGKKKEDVYKMINNRDIASVKFGQAVDRLAKDYVPELLEHPAFSSRWIDMVSNSTQPVLIEDQDPEKEMYDAKSKAKASQQTKGDDVEIKTISRYKNADRTNSKYETTEDGYIDVYRFMDLFDQTISKDNILNAYKTHALNLGSYIKDSASIERGYRGMDSRWAIPYNGIKTNTAAAIDRKSEEGGVPGTYEPLVQGGYKMFYHLDDNGADWNSDIEKTMADWIKTYDQDSYGDVSLKFYLDKLATLDPKSSYDEKFDKLTIDHKYSTMNSSMDIIINDKGVPVWKYNPGQRVEGTSKYVESEIKRRMYNYSTMKALYSGEKGQNAQVLKGYKIDGDKYKENEEQLKEAYKALQEEYFKNKAQQIAQEERIKQYIPDDIVPAEVLSANKAKSIVKSDHKWYERFCSWFSRTGINETTEGGVQASTAVKNYKSSTMYTMATLNNEMKNVIKVLNDTMPPKIQEEYTSLLSLVKSLETIGEKQKDADTVKTELKLAGFDTYEEAKQRFEQLSYRYPEAAKVLGDYTDHLVQHLNKISSLVNEPFGLSLVGMLSPYVKENSDKNKKENKAKARNVIQTFVGMKGMRSTGERKENIKFDYDFVNSSKQLINYIAKMESLEYIQADLKHRGVLSNDKLYEAVNETLDYAMKNMTDEVKFAGIGDKTKINRNLVKQIEKLTGLIFDKGEVNSYSFASLVDYYNKINQTLDAVNGAYQQEYEDAVDGYTDLTLKSREHLKTEQFRTRGIEEEYIANLYYSKMLIGQMLIEGNSDFATAVSGMMSKFATKGDYVLTNKWGQKIDDKNFKYSISPLTLMDMREEIEIAMNNVDKEKWSQYLFGKILSGELYLCEKDSAEALENTIYTYKIPDGFKQVLQKVSKWSASLIMSNPIKIPSRFTRFTLEDYGFLTAYTGNPITAAYYAYKARKQLWSAFKSNGGNMTPELEEYMKREGQPIKSGIVAADVGVKEYNPDKNKLETFLEKLSSPLEYQNHLGRYAIYLAALDSFSGKGMKGPALKGKNYGAAYMSKEGIDKLEKNEDKAMFVMDYMLGSPGGFPKISSDISGYFMYTTFPLNFIRTAGAYSLSVAKEIADAGKDDTGALTSLISPFTGLASVTASYWLLTWIIGHIYGLSDEEIKELQDNFGTVDIVNTIASGTPVQSSDSSNPVGTFVDTFITPITDAQERNDYQVSQGNDDNLAGEIATSYIAKVASKLNPLLKTPAEIISQHDFYDTSFVDTSNLYTREDNIIRKAIGNVFGSELGTSIVDQYKADQYDEDQDFFRTVSVGVGNGIAKQVGIKQADKNGTTNYYDMITAVKNAYSQQTGTSQTVDLEDTSGIVEEYSNNSEWNYDDYSRVRNEVKKMMQLGKDATSVYAYLTDEYKNNGVSGTTLKSVINSVSLKRAIDRLPDKDAFYASLTEEQLSKLDQALEYEEQIYPDLEDKFKSVSSSSSSGYSSNYSSNYGSSSNYSKNYYSSSVPYFHSIYASSPYFKSIYYNNYYNKKYKNNNNKKRVVQVDKNMGLGRYGVQDFKPNLYYKNNPVYNNLSDYQKQKKVGER